MERQDLAQVHQLELFQVTWMDLTFLRRDVAALLDVALIAPEPSQIFTAWLDSFCVVLRGPSRGEELQLDIYLCIPAGSLKDKDAPRPKVALTVFVRQEEPERRPSAPQRLAEGVLRREIGRSKTTLGGYVLASLSLSGAESRQELFCVLQNAAPQETWPWQLRLPKHAETRIRAKDGEAAGEAGCSQPMGVPEEPPLRCAVLGGVAEPGRIHTCWPEAVGLYSPKQRPSPSRPQSEEEELVGLECPVAIACRSRCPVVRLEEFQGEICATWAVSIICQDFANGQGGSDACTDMEDPENAGLPACLASGEHGSSLQEVYQQFCTQVSLADFLVIAAEAVIASTRARAAGTASLDLRSIFRFGRRTWDVWTRVTR
eukprot:g1488.t1